MVVASIKPLQLIAAAVTEGISTPALAVGPGQDPHHLSLRPSERSALQQAALVLWVGPLLELPLVDVITALDAPVVTVQALTGIALVQAEAARATDPHLWLDSRNARVIATALVTQLQQLDAGNAARYAANAEKFTAQLAALDVELERQLQPLRSRPWAVSHHAFRYFTEQHGLSEPLSLTDTANNAPGVRRTLMLRQQLQSGSIHCLLTEPTENQQELVSLVEDSDVAIVSADVLGTELVLSADAYSSLLRQLAIALTTCIGGSDE